MYILSSTIDEKGTDIFNILEYIVPVPVKFVLEHGYKLHSIPIEIMQVNEENITASKGKFTYVEVNAPYDKMCGVSCPKQYYEW